MFLQKRHKIKGVINSNILGEFRMKKAIVSFVILLMAVFFLAGCAGQKNDKQNIYTGMKHLLIDKSSVSNINFKIENK